MYWKRSRNKLSDTKAWILLSTVLFVFHPSFLVAQDRSLRKIPSFVEAERKAALASDRMVPLKRRTASDYDVIYSRCEWDVDPAVRFIRGKVMTRFNPLSATFSQLELDLSNQLVVDTVNYHGAHLSYLQTADDLLQIQFPSSLPQSVIDSVEIIYHGIPPGTGFGSFVNDQHNGVPILWTLSQPYGAKDWWPCHQDLNDKIDSLDIYVTSPAGMKVAGNGVLVAELPVAAGLQTHWKTTYPTAAYLVAFAVTNYTAFSDYLHFTDGDSTFLLHYIYPEDSSFVREQLANERFAEVVVFFDSLFGPYPFRKEKYGQAEFGWGGGMEHQTMSFIGNFDPTLMAHECAHQWFGDKITCGSWADIWLNEGFATYLQGLARQYTTPVSWQPFLSGLINTITAEAGGSVYCNDTSSFSSIFDYRLSYAKGAYLLHMLRWVSGDQAFFSGVRNYLEDPSLMYRYAKSDDLRRHLEQASGRDLVFFFSQWLYGKGFPSYEVEWNQQASGVNVVLYQTQSDPTVSFFKMPVPVLFSGEDRDTLVVFDHLFSGQQFSFDPGFTVTAVSFDPEHWILSANNKVVTTKEKNASLFPVLLFPNPVKDALSVIVSEPAFSVLSYRIIDGTGRTVLSERPENPLRSFELNVSAISSGFYFLEVETVKGISTLQFCKTK